MPFGISCAVNILPTKIRLIVVSKRHTYSPFYWGYLWSWIKYHEKWGRGKERVHERVDR